MLVERGRENDDRRIRKLQQVARKLGVHRRLVREALDGAVPKECIPAVDDDARVHFCLYCVRTRDERFEAVEADIVRALAKDVLVALVLTQCPTSDDSRANRFAQYLTSLELPVLDGKCFMTLAEEDNVAGVTLPPFGLPDLVSAIYHQLPDAALGQH